MSEKHEKHEKPTLFVWVPIFELKDEYVEKPYCVSGKAFVSSKIPSVDPMNLLAGYESNPRFTNISFVRWYNCSEQENQGMAYIEENNR